jgi:diadenylate cyclase
MVNKKLEEMLLQITPGTPLREGVYNIIDAGIGALIVVGMDEAVEKMLDGVNIHQKEYLN